MSNTSFDLIDALANSKTSDANNVFNSIMQDKITSALDAEKINLANQVYNGVETSIEQEISTDAEVQGTETPAETE